MTTDTTTPGSNSRGTIVAYAERMTRLLDDKAAIDEDIKALKGEMKSASFGKDEMKAFAQCVKELRRGADYQADQLQLELILDTYRGALDLPRDLEVAQTRARAAAETLPDGGDGVSDDGDAYAETGARRRSQAAAAKRGGLN